MKAKLTIKNYRCFTREEPATIELGHDFTAFVGPNNSGKSSLLKLFYELRGVFETIGAHTNVKPLIRGIAGFSFVGTSPGGYEVFSKSNDGPIELDFQVDGSGHQRPAGREVPQHVIVRLQPGGGAVRVSLRHNQVTIDQTDIGATRDDGSVSSKYGEFDLMPFIDCAKSLASSVYIGPFRNALVYEGKDNYFDIPVGKAFVERWNQYKTGPVAGLNERILTITESIRQVFGFERLDVNAAAGGDTFKIFIDGKAFRLDEVGAGLAQFVMVLTAVAMEPKDWILIDEPEAGLHPALQLDFLATIGAHSKGLMFASHNLGLARAVAQRVYVVRQAAGRSSVTEIGAVRSLAEFVGELSFGGYQELGFEKLLLVEGVTEVKTLQQWLKHRGKDHQVVILPLGGSSFINGNREQELLELTRITRPENVFVLIDSERAAAAEPLEPGRLAFLASCQSLTFRHHVLDRRATENYLADTAAKAAIHPKVSALGHFQPLDGRWGKSDNWKIAAKMERSDLDGTDLGAFLDSI